MAFLAKTRPAPRFFDHQRVGGGFFAVWADVSKVAVGAVLGKRHPLATRMRYEQKA